VSKQTKEERKEAAKKGAATRQENDAKEARGDLKHATDQAMRAARNLGKSAAGAAGKTAKAASKRVDAERSKRGK
jgi:hypothetical protein